MSDDDQIGIFDEPEFFDDPDDAPTLSEARLRYRAALPKGSRCPCCDRYGQSYIRKLNSGMAAALIWLVAKAQELTKDEWIDVPKEAPRGVLAKARDFTILRYWGLIERPGSEDGRKKHPGLWRPTSDGIAFVRGERNAPSHVVVYNDQVERFEGTTTIAGALGERFRYDELLATWGLKKGSS